MKKIVSTLLSTILVLTMFTGCKNLDGIEKSKIQYPVPTDAEAVVDSAAGLAVNYYMAGRAYLDQFLNYDVSTLNEDNIGEYNKLIDNCLKSFENADKVNDMLGEALDTFEKMPQGEGPKKGSLRVPGESFETTAYASAEMGSKEWAQNIMDEYAKAKPGYAIRHLAGQLGTDCKHAYAQMKMAQDILMGAEYTQIAEAANTAVKTASVLKTAGTAAQLGIAIATANPAGAFEAAVTTGGMVMSGINTVLEIGSTSSIIYTNGDDNEFSMACDKTEAQLAPIGQIFAIAGIGSNISSLTKSGKDIYKNGLDALTPKMQEEIIENGFGIFSYGAGAINDYINGGSLLSGTFTKTDNGIKFTLLETVMGTEPKQQEAVNTVLKEAGISEDKIKIAKTAIAEDKSKKDDQNSEEQPTVNVNNMQPEVANNIINNTKPIMQDDFDLEAYLKLLREVLYEIAEMGYEEEYEEMSKEGKGDFIETICGTYHLTGTCVSTGPSPSDRETESVEYTLAVSEAGDSNINVRSVDGEGEVLTLPIDPSTGVAYLDLNSINQGFEHTLKFKVSGGKVHLDMKIFGDLTFEDSEAYYTDTTILSGDKE